MADFMSQYCYLASGGCRCTCRIDFAIGTRRAGSGQSGIFQAADSRTAGLHQHLEAMEKIEEHMTVFDTLSAYALPEEKRQTLQDVVASVWMEKYVRIKF